MGWIVAVIFILIFILYLLFIHGASSGRSERYQQKLDDEQMRCVSRDKKREKNNKKQK
ncbi:MAG: hypothetical protein LUI87_10430 [Lachnospiraceae bacterium]|nr:hypothetical protein [Lachnospiraceae bacterium]